MPYSFPASPQVDDEHVVSGRTFTWDGKGWMPNLSVIVVGGGGGEVPTLLSIGFGGTAKLIDLNAADVQTLRLDSPTCALTFTGLPAAGFVRSIILKIFHGAGTTARTVTWPAGMWWENRTFPFLPTVDNNAYSVFEIMAESDGTLTGFHAGNFFP